MDVIKKNYILGQGKVAGDGRGDVEEEKAAKLRKDEVMIT